MQKVNEKEYVEGMTNVCITYNNEFDQDKHPLLRAVDYSKKGLYIDDSWGIPNLKGINMIVKAVPTVSEKKVVVCEKKSTEPSVKKSTVKIVENYYTKRLAVSLEDIIL